MEIFPKKNLENWLLLSFPYEIVIDYKICALVIPSTWEEWTHNYYQSLRG